LYKFYGDILTKINIFLKISRNIIKLTLNSIQNFKLWFGFELEI